MSFASKVVIVTGASSGIGATTAILFAKEGADVAIVARTQEKLAAVAKQIEARGKKPLIIQADVSKEADAATIIPKTIKQFGKLDILVNNAGVTIDGSLLDGKALEAYDSVMKTNVRSIIQLTIAATPFLSKTKGNIVNISSVLGVSVNNNPQMLAYHVSKAAVDHFTRCAARELASLGVRVNNVNPGPVDNEFLANNSFEDIDKHNKSFLEMVALGFMATNEDLGNTILFVASDKARSITGSTYYVDNGYLLKN